jgi:60 kDa SS-A/Ro ribonucleoprotein
VTGCLNDTFYASATDQLDQAMEFAKKVEPRFLAQVAVYSRTQGYMKDMPALCLAVLASIKTDEARGLMTKVFPMVIDNGKMLRNFVQIIRSGVTGKKSLSALPRKLIKQVLDSWDDDHLFRQDIGQDPSLADVIKMAHPKPKSKGREAMYGYLLGKKHKPEMLGKLVTAYEAYKNLEDRTGHAVPAVPFQKLTALNLSTEQWTGIAQKAPWHMTRMNLNTFQRHGVFDNSDVTKLIAERLRDKDIIHKVKVFPYQLMMAYYATQGSDIPHDVREALQDAMETSLDNTPAFEGDVVVAVDTSGSMGQPVTGYRGSSTSKVSCAMVAGLFASAVKRTTPAATIGTFDTSWNVVPLNSRDSVMTNAARLSRAGGGTDCSVALKELNKARKKADAVVYVSDGQSWADFTSNRSWGWGGPGTGMADEWKEFKRRNPKAKLVSIDVQPYATKQADNAVDVLSVGGFSDRVFDVVADFIRDGSNPDLWVSKIEGVEI